jgi:recombination associated protein RdgC
MSAADLESQLADRPMQPCGPFEITSRGWMPVTSGSRLLHTVNRQYMIALGANEKLLPGSIVRQIAARWLKWSNIPVVVTAAGCDSR